MHTGVTYRDLECTVTFEERQQVLNVTERVRGLEYNPESCELASTHLTPACSFQSRFAMLEEVPSLLRNETDQEREGLADDMELAITYFRRLLRDQLEVSNKGERKGREGERDYKGKGKEGERSTGEREDGSFREGGGSGSAGRGKTIQCCLLYSQMFCFF